MVHLCSKCRSEPVSTRRMDLAFGSKIESEFERDAAIEKFVLGLPGDGHGFLIDFAGANVAGDQRGRKEIRRTRVGKREKRTRAGNHAMALVLAVSGVTDFFGESEIGVLQCAEDRGVNADVERFATIGIACGIEKQIDGFGIGAS